MNRAIITANQALALVSNWGTDPVTKLALKETVVKFTYSADGYAEFTAKIRVNIWRGDADPRVICPFCGGAALALHVHPTRIGLCCAACISRVQARAKANALVNPDGHPLNKKRKSKKDVA